MVQLMQTHDSQHVASRMRKVVDINLPVMYRGPLSCHGQRSYRVYWKALSMIKLFSLKQQSKDGTSSQSSRKTSAAYLRIQKGKLVLLQLRHAYIHILVTGWI